MTFVLDASAALALALPDERSSAGAIVAGRLKDGRAVVPPIWQYEVTNALVAARRNGRVSEAAAARMIVLFDSLPVETASPPTMQALAEVAMAHGLTAYDSAYLSLALDRGLPLATLDAALARAAGEAGTALILGLD